jgi:hypothetical protein
MRVARLIASGAKNRPPYGLGRADPDLVVRAYFSADLNYR